MSLSPAVAPDNDDDDDEETGSVAASRAAVLSDIVVAATADSLTGASWHIVLVSVLYPSDCWATVYAAHRCRDRARLLLASDPGFGTERRDCVQLLLAIPASEQNHRDYV
jgi:hypothetical protein